MALLQQHSVITIFLLVCGCGVLFMLCVSLAWQGVDVLPVSMGLSLLEEAEGMDEVTAWPWWKYSPVDYSTLVPSSGYHNGRDVICDGHRASPGDRIVEIKDGKAVTTCRLLARIFTKVRPRMLTRTSKRTRKAAAPLRPRDIPDDASTLLVYAYSAPGNTWHRDMVRRTWANGTYYAHFSMRIHVVFILGVSYDAQGNPDQDTLAALGDESATYGDLLVLNLTDSYDTLVLKGIGAMQWLTQHYPKIEVFVKTDDDIVLNGFDWLSQAERLRREQDPVGSHILCRFYYIGGWPQRRGKYRVKPGEYPEAPYPYYCAGYAYLMTRNAVLAVLQGVSHVPLFRMEDIYLSGLVPEAMGVTRIQMIGSLTFNETKHPWLEVDLPRPSDWNDKWQQIITSLTR